MDFNTKPHVLKSCDARALSFAERFIAEFAFDEFELSLAITNKIGQAVMHGCDELQHSDNAWPLLFKQAT
jgi:hypothetical protein